MLWDLTIRITLCAVAFAVLAFGVLAGGAATAPDRIAWASTLPTYDHIVVVIEENKDVEQVFGSEFDAPYIRMLARQGALITRMFGEEHYSQGNYFWLFS